MKKDRVSHRFLIICGLFVSASLGLAQSSPSCTSESANPVMVSGNGVAELISDFVIHCRGGVPTPAGKPIPRITLQAIISSDLTSKILGQKLPPSPPPAPFTPQLNEALLLVDEPAPKSQLPCPALPCSIQGTGGSPNPYDGSTGHYNVFQATLSNLNAIEWDGVPFDPPGSTGTRTLRITNVRTNVYEFAHSGCLECLAGVMFVRSPDLVINNPQQQLAYAAPDLLFESTTAIFAPSQAHNATGPSVDFTISFAERFDNTFKPRTIAPDPDDESSTANQNIPGQAYPTASGFYNASFAGTYAGAGLATQGTRLVARFKNVPAGVSLFVTGQPIAGSDTLRVQLVSTGPNGEGPYHPVEPNANGFFQIAVNNGVAVAVWEVTSASPTSIESTQFGVAVSIDPKMGPIEMGTATVAGSLGPLTSVMLASATDPVPRYVEGAAQPAFRIGVHLTPSVSAVVNAADFAAHSPLAPGSIAAIFGLGLSSYSGVSFGPPQASLAGTTVRINGLVAPIFAANPGQVNIQIPWELAGTTEALLVVVSNGQESDPVAVKIADPSPYIFVTGGQPLIVRSLPLVASASLTIYGTGFGPVQNRPATGAPALDFSSTTLNATTLTIGGVPAEVTYSGLAPGLTGVWQINAKLPDVAIGPYGVEVKLSIDGVAANPVTLGAQ